MLGTASRSRPLSAEMNQRRWVLKKLFAIALLSVFAVVLPVQAAGFEENVHYELILPEPDQGKAGDKIEVAEFFMYACPHCYNFEPTINAWKARKAEDIEFVRIPAMFGKHFNLHAQAFYALEAMGELERVHDAFFEEIHEKRNMLKTREALETFMEGQGIELAAFRKAWASFAVAAKTNRAATLMRRYGIRSVPKLVIDGRYRSGKLGHQDMTRLADELAGKVRQDRATR